MLCVLCVLRCIRAALRAVCVMLAPAGGGRGWGGPNIPPTSTNGRRRPMILAYLSGSRSLIAPTNGALQNQISGYGGRNAEDRQHRLQMSEEFAICRSRVCTGQHVSLRTHE